MILITQMHYKGKNMMLAKIKNKCVTVIIYYNNFTFDCKIQNLDFEIQIRISQSNAINAYIFFVSHCLEKDSNVTPSFPLG